MRPNPSPMVGSGGHPMSELRKYWSEIAQSAFLDAWEAARLDSPVVLMIALLGTAVGISLLILTADDHAARAEIMLRIATGAILVIFFLTVFAWKLANGPVDRDRALRDVIASLQKQTLDKSHHLAVHERLGEFWREGDDLAPREGMNMAVEKVNWTVRVERYLEEVGLLDEAVGFKTLGGSGFDAQLSKLRKIWMRAAKRASS